MARKIRQQICANCSHTFFAGENFCPNCGQENHSPNQPIKHYTGELIESIFHLDSKIFLTLKTMLMYPGKITREYNENMRARFTPPVRLYVFISFIFFVLIQIPSKNDRITEDKKNTIIQPIDSIPKVNNWILSSDSTSNDSNITFKLAGIKLEMTLSELKELKKANIKELDSLIVANKMKPNYFTRTLFKQIIRSLNADESFQEKITDKFLKFGSLSLFFLMPFFALLLAIAYFRRKKNYYEYLIFSIHYHTLVFLILSLVLLINILIVFPEGLYVILFIGLFYYLGKSLRCNYNGSRTQTILKMIFISIFYWFVSLLVAIVVLMLGWWFV